MLISNYLSSNMIICNWFFDLTHFRELGQNYRNILVRFLVQIKTAKFASESNWPLKNLRILLQIRSQLSMKACTKVLWSNLLRLLIMPIVIELALPIVWHQKTTCLTEKIFMGMMVWREIILVLSGLGSPMDLVNLILVICLLLGFLKIFHHNRVCLMRLGEWTY